MTPVSCAGCGTSSMPHTMRPRARRAHWRTSARRDDVRHLDRCYDARRYDVVWKLLPLRHRQESGHGGHRTDPVRVDLRAHGRQLEAVHGAGAPERVRALGTPAMPETAALWISRLVLLVCVILHIHAATVLTIMNREARPAGYRG